MLGVEPTAGLAETFSLLRVCGNGRRECVAYLTGPLDSPGIVDQVLHPEHSARPDHYEIAPAWLDKTWIELARATEHFGVQDMIDPRDSRPLLCAWARDAYRVLPELTGRPSFGTRP